MYIPIMILDAYPLPDSWIPQVSGKGLGPGFSLSGPRVSGNRGGCPEGPADFSLSQLIVHSDTLAIPVVFLSIYVGYPSGL